MLEPAPTDLADLVGLAPTPTFTERVGVIRHVLVPSRGLGDLVDSLGGRPFRWNELSPIHTPAPDERPTEANAESPDDLSGDEGAGDTAGGGISAGAFQDGEFSIGVVADDAGSAHLATVFGALRRLGQTTDRTIGIELCGLAGAPLSEAAIAAGLVVGDHVRVIEETELDARRPDWSVQLWIPGAVETVFGSLEQIRAAGADAVPTATVDRLVDGAAGLVPDVLSISDGNSEKDWTASLELLLADPTLAPMLGQLAKRRTETLGGLRVAGSIIDRLWGWLQCH